MSASPSRELVEALRRIQQPRAMPRWRRLVRRLHVFAYPTERRSVDG